MFPLRERYVTRGYGKPMWYTPFHCGTDYRAAIGTELFAPKNGTIVFSGYGKDGGNTVHFQTEDGKVQMRFMHLSKILIPRGRVSEGQVIALTGNTGALTTGPHLHIDVATNWPYLYWKDAKNLVDPEAYQWEAQQPVQPEPAPVPEVVPVEAPAPEPIRVSFAPFTTRLTPSKEYSDEAARVQRFLQRLGYLGDIGGDYGYYGPKTQAAVHAFQKANGITSYPQNYGWWYDKTMEAANRYAPNTYVN